MAEDNQVVPTVNSVTSDTPLIFNKDTKELIKKAKVLMVGAGGIGCELLKNLVLTGFEDIEIIDLDTIDVSNLNRQFLFHKKHVGMPKARVAKDTALEFNPKAKIIAHHDSITSSAFGITYISKFDLVLNALDNTAARNHVNRICLAAKVPLIESGTSGYLGQVETIIKNVTACYECFPKMAQKTYPGCTIRNTPSELIHCIVWAKHLFNQLFGEQDPMNEDEDVSPNPADEEANQTERTVPMAITMQSTREWAKKKNYDALSVFRKLFHDDIKVLLSMGKLWEKRRSPTPIVQDTIHASKSESSEKKDGTIMMPDQRLWDLSKCRDIFFDCINNLRESLKKSSHGFLVWDKDDKVAMDFVSSSANIRAHIFKIQQKSPFEIKSMAGNIVPAIATSNAVVAGLIVLRAVNILRGAHNQCQTVYVRNYPNPRGYVIAREEILTKQNPSCTVCSPRPTVTIATDINKMKLKEFDILVLKKKLNMIEPELLLVSTGNLILSSEEGEADDLKERTLSNLGVSDGSLLEADDFSQNYKIRIIIMNREQGRNDPPFVEVDKAGDFKPKEEASKNGDSELESKPAKSRKTEENECAIIYDTDDEDHHESRKRKIQDNPVPVKKRRADDKMSEDEEI